MVMLLIPYPLGFYAKGLDARIDDTQDGWKAEACGRPKETGRLG